MHYSSHAFQAWQKPSTSGPCPAGCHARPLRRSMLRQTGLPRAAFTASEKIRRARPALQKNMMCRGKRRSATSRSGKRPGRRIIRRDSRKFALLPHEASEPRKSVVVRPLLQSPAHSLAAPMRRACDANPRAAQIPRRFCGKPKSPQACPPGPLERFRAAARPHSPLLRKGCAARLRRPPR